MDERRMLVLHAVKMKGRAAAGDVAAATGLAGDAVRDAIEELVSAGALAEVRDRVRVTDAGRSMIDEYLQAERQSVHAGAIEALYGEFCAHNAELKEIITAWQLRPDGTPNDHVDPAYDARVLDRLAAVHGGVRPVLDGVATHCPRMRRYRTRLDAAIDRVQAGDHRYVATPLIESYHTVWFELHEDFIHLSGRTRAEEAAAGRG